MRRSGGEEVRKRFGRFFSYVCELVCDVCTGGVLSVPTISAAKPEEGISPCSILLVDVSLNLSHQNSHVNV